MPDSCKKQLKTAKDLIPQSCITSAVLWQMAFWHFGKSECLLPPCVLNSSYIEWWWKKPSTPIVSYFLIFCVIRFPSICEKALSNRLEVPLFAVKKWAGWGSVRLLPLQDNGCCHSNLIFHLLPSQETCIHLIRHKSQCGKICAMFSVALVIESFSILKLRKLTAVRVRDNEGYCRGKV